MSIFQVAALWLIITLLAAIARPDSLPSQETTASLDEYVPGTATGSAWWVINPKTSQKTKPHWAGTVVRNGEPTSATASFNLVATTTVLGGQELKALAVATRDFEALPCHHLPIRWGDYEVTVGSSVDHYEVSISPTEGATEPDLRWGFGSHAGAGQCERNYQIRRSDGAILSAWESE